MRNARWVWVLMCCTLGSCGGRHEVGIGDGALGGGGSSGAGSGSAGSDSAGSGSAGSGSAGSGVGGASVATGGTSTTAGSTTSTGAGGSGSLPPVTTCVMTSMKACSGIGCHGRSIPVANLSLTFESLTTNYKALYYDKPNQGLTPPDPLYCAAGAGKLVDPANPMQSLIYRKLLTPAERDANMRPPCGEPMPAIGMVSSEDKACVLQWIGDVIAGSEAQR